MNTTAAPCQTVVTGWGVTYTEDIDENTELPSSTSETRKTVPKATRAVNTCQDRSALAKKRRRGETVGSLRPAKKPTCAVRGVNVSHVCTSRQRGMPSFALSIDERPRQANGRILAPFPRLLAGCLLFSSREKTQKGSTPPQFGEAPSLISFQKRCLWW